MSFSAMGAVEVADTVIGVAMLVIVIVIEKMKCGKVEMALVTSERTTVTDDNKGSRVAREPPRNPSRTSS
jgi:hypothetical protein